MEDEIKEILQTLENSIYCNFDLHTQEKKKLLDYITNLHEEKEDYKSRNKKAIEYIKNEMPYLQEVDEEFENVDGEVYFTYKEWNGNDLLNILQGEDKDE